MALLSRQPRRALWGAALLALVGAAPPARAGDIRVGDRFPAVTLKDWQGGTATLDTARGRPLIVDFWASWCRICRAALPSLDAWSRRHSSEQLTVIAVNIDTDRGAADRFLAEYLPQPALRLLRDPGGSAFARLGAQGMPALYLIDRDGVVRLVKAGYTPEELPEIERAVDGLLSASGEGRNAEP